MEPSRGLSIRILAFAAFSAICYFGATVIITVLISIFIAYLLDPLVNLLSRIRIPRVLAISVCMLFSGVVVAALILLLVERMQEFSERLPRYRTKVQMITSDIRNRVLLLEKQSEDIGKTIMPQSQPTRRLPAVRIEEPSSWYELFFRKLGPLYDYLIQITFFPFLVYFLLSEKEKIRMFVSNLVRGSTSLSSTLVRDTSDKIVNDLNQKIRGFIIGSLVSTGVVFLVAWALFLSFRVDEAFLWALLFALLNVLPFVGAILSAVPPILISVFQFTSVQQSILLIALCLGVHLVYANLLLPRLAGPRTELSPLVVVLAMMYWGFLWGAIGIFLAIPLTASLRSIWMQYRLLQPAEPLARY
jgi:AI-2 transport protein TqsA